MTNTNSSTFLLIMIGILLVNCGDNGETSKLTKINFSIDEAAENQAALYDDFQPQDYNEKAPAHDQRTEILLGSTVEFKNISEPVDEIKSTYWFVFPFQNKDDLTPTAEGINFTHTFDRPGNFEVMMQTNGKNKIKIVRVVTEYLNEFAEVVPVDSSQIEIPEKNAIKDEDGDGIPNDEDDCPNEFGDIVTKGCPDSDGDGVPNIKDNCPDEKGTIRNSGCPNPDTDASSANRPKFPFPPPKPSAREVIPIEKFSKSIEIRDIERVLRKTLDSCGYHDKSFYEIPNGFALVTRIEKINNDATPKRPPQRWEAASESAYNFSMTEYIKSLFSSNPGYYRVLVFMVTDVPFSTSEQAPSKKEANVWLSRGMNVLPEDVASTPITKQYSCSVLIYEFKSPESGEQASLMNPSRHTGRTHLMKTNLWRYLNQYN